MFTKILSPTLASQAPRVSITNAKIEIFVILVMKRNEGIKSTADSIIPSKHSKVINRW